MAQRITITGGDKLAKALREAGVLAHVALTAAMVEEQEKVIAEAKTRTPVDTGTLRNSGTVLPPHAGGSSITVESGFGGAASKYAIYVHENLKARHPVGRSKFLESAFLSRVPQMPGNLAKSVELAWRRLAR